MPEAIGVVSPIGAEGFPDARGEAFRGGHDAAAVEGEYEGGNRRGSEQTRERLVRLR